MFNPDQFIEIGEARRGHMRQEAQRAWLIKEARGVRSKRSKQFLKWNGDILIRLGYKLHATRNNGSRPFIQIFKSKILVRAKN